MLGLHRGLGFRDTPNGRVNVGLSGRLRTRKLPATHRVPAHALRPCQGLGCGLRSSRKPKIKGNYRWGVWGIWGFYKASIRCVYIYIYI